MARFTLTLLDTTSVQSYIFGSNRLRENLGASQLVHSVTSTWLGESLHKVVGGSHNLRPAPAEDDLAFDESRALTPENDLQAEVIFAGGGNALILFRGLAQAKAVVRELSGRLLTEAPGLELAVAHQEFDWQHDRLGGEGGVVEKLQAKLSHAKQQRHSGELLGQSVTLECSSTGLPAVTYFPFGENDALPLSADALAKASDITKDAAKKRFECLIGDAASGYEFSDDLDNLVSRAGDKRYIAVVHADGNGIGKRFKQIRDEGGDKRAYVQRIRNLSHAIGQAGKRALRETVQALTQALNSQQRPPELEDFKKGLCAKDGRPFLPFRPIVFGGDDVTFVCDGRLGLPLAAIYLRAWERASADLPEGGAAHACAGIAVVKTHYPFARAYELSEDLCRNAKRHVKNARQEGSALDWHFALSGIFGDSEAIRSREYKLRLREFREEATLVMRPIALHQSLFEPPWRTWKHFQHLVGVFRDKRINEQRFDPQGKPYANANVVKGLREALRAGPDAVKSFRLARAHQKGLPEIDPLTPTLQETGWVNGRTPYFDPIEALDFFLPLEPWENLR